MAVCVGEVCDDKMGNACTNTSIMLYFAVKITQVVTKYTIWLVTYVIFTIHDSNSRLKPADLNGVSTEVCM